MLKLLLVVAVVLASGCDKKKNAPSASSPPTDAAVRIATDPAEQILLLEAAIDKRRRAIRDLPVEGREQKIKAIEREVQILEQNLGRVRAKLKL